MTDTVDMVPEFKLYCNQSDDVVWSQIKQNVRRGTPRLTFRSAVIVGGGPSLPDHFAEIERRKQQGFDIFALNAAHDYLIQNAAIIPTHHVMYDSREFMADMVRSWRSDIHYYVSSQCHPSVFEALAKAPRVTMFHSVNYDNALEFFSEHDPNTVVLGGAPTVGIQAINLMVPLGYRRVELYGYDSSWRDDMKHAYVQAANGDQTARTFIFDGKEYFTSAPMAAQSERFFADYMKWRELGIDIRVVGDGLLPDMWRHMTGQSGCTIESSEVAKYTAMWRYDEYRKMSPGALSLGHFLSVMKPPIRGRSAVIRTKIIDFGCGTGRATQRLKDMGYDVLGVDFAPNAVDQEVSIPFCLANIWDLPPDMTGDYGYCCDVMEHIPPEKVDDALAGIARCVPNAYFRINYLDDKFGSRIGKKLHLTINSEKWWLQKLSQFWSVAVVDGAFICRRKHD